MTVEKKPGRLAINAAVVPQTAALIGEAVERTGAVLSGHFSFLRGTHVDTALRFRAIGRDSESVAMVARELAAIASWDWKGAKVLCPESAGFFLGYEVAACKDVPCAVVKTDLRRIPTSELIAGEVNKGDRIVLVNDIGNTGRSLEPMLSLIKEHSATVVGVLLFAVVDEKAFLSFCNEQKLQAHYLTIALWESVSPTECTGCREGAALVPILELS